jgi:two-component system sensor histidine kinase KdpD
MNEGLSAGRPPPRGFRLHAAGLAMVPRFDIVNVAMVYLLAVVVIALRFSRRRRVCQRRDLRGRLRLRVRAARSGRSRWTTSSTCSPSPSWVAWRWSSPAAGEAHGARIAARTPLAGEAETERMRSTLLASISHDLRTPLAVMAGASSSLAEGARSFPSAERDALAREHLRTVARHVRAGGQGVCR